MCPEAVILYPLHLASLEALEKLETVIYKMLSLFGTDMCFVKNFVAKSRNTLREALGNRRLIIRRGESATRPPEECKPFQLIWFSISGSAYFWGHVTSCLNANWLLQVSSFPPVVSGSSSRISLACRWCDFSQCWHHMHCRAEVYWVLGLLDQI